MRGEKNEKKECGVCKREKCFKDAMTTTLPVMSAECSSDSDSGSRRLIYDQLNFANNQVPTQVSRPVTLHTWSVVAGVAWSGVVE